MSSKFSPCSLPPVHLRNVKKLLKRVSRLVTELPQPALSDLDACRLEDRVLFSAGPMDPGADFDIAGEDLDRFQELPSDSDAWDLPGLAALDDSVDELAWRDTLPAAKEIVFVDSKVQDYDQFVADLAESTGDRDLLVIVLDAERDGVQQVSETLALHDDLSAIHLVSHGRPGEVQLGNVALSGANLDMHATQIQKWRHSLQANADLLVYGCDLAGNTEGESLLGALGALTGADVAGSNDATGHASLDGDWDLEFKVGHIQTSLAFSSALQQSWTGVLDAVAVTTTDDVVDGDTTDISSLLVSPGGSGISLREAILAANNTTAIDTVTIPTGVFVLKNGQLSITEDLIINGDGAERTIIDGDAENRVWDVDNNAVVSMRDVTMQNGDATSGGGLYVRLGADVTVEQAVFRDHDTNFGGAIRNRGTLTLRDVEVFDNVADDGGGLMNEGVATIERSLFFQNSGDRGGAIYNTGTFTSIVNTTISSNSTDAGGVGGAGIYTTTAIPVTNSTIVFNSASGSSGGGIHVTGAGDVVLQNSILADNSGGNINGANTITSADYNIVDDNTTLTAALGNDQTGSGLDPGMSPILQDNGGYTRTHALQLGSIAIDPGGMTGAPADDQRGFARTDGDTDIGAYEAPITYIVTSTDDSAAVGTLRWAIAQANALPDENLIAFAIPDNDSRHFYYQDDSAAGLTGVTTTSLDDLSIGDFDPDYPFRQFSWFSIDMDESLSQLTLTNPVTIDGFTQPGAAPNSRSAESDAVIRIELTASDPNDDFRGITFAAGSEGSLVRGLAVNDFEWSGMMVEFGVDRITIHGNNVGTDVTGINSRANGDSGIQLRGDQNQIGGETPQNRNLISGGNARGIAMFSGGTLTGNVIENNFIGVDSTGSGALGNQTAGIQVYNSDGALIRGNVISGNSGDGIWFRNSGGNTNNVVYRNLIGVGADGTTAVGNTTAGILIEGPDSNNTIGLEGLGNVIAYNTTFAIDATTGSQNTFRANNMYANTSGSIRLAGGVNTDQPAPVISNAEMSGGPTAIYGSYNSAADAGQTIDLDFFASPINSPSEGRTWVGSEQVTLDGSGFAAVIAAFHIPNSIGQFITATATDVNGNTSELSAAQVIGSASALWFSTIDSVNTSGNPDLDGWRKSDIVQFGGPGFDFDPVSGTTTGRLVEAFDVHDFMMATPRNVTAMHFVSRDITVGTSPDHFDLKRGDLLLSLDADGLTVAGETTSITVSNEDVFVFRPVTSGDYSRGEVFALLDDPTGVGKSINGITLVESPVVIGDQPLAAGTFLFSREGNSGTGFDEQDRIYTYLASTIGQGNTSGVRQTLIEGGISGNLGFSDAIIGIDVIEADTTIGGASLLAGDLLLTLNASGTVGGSGTPVEAQDVFTLRLTTTLLGSGTSTGDASLLFDGSDEQMMPADTTESIGGLTLSSAPSGNAVPMANAGGPYAIKEGESLSLDASGSSDTDGIIVAYEWDLDNDSIYGDVTTVSPVVSWASLAAFGIDDGDALGTTYVIGLRVRDDLGATSIAATNVTVNNVAPMLSVTGALTAAEDDVYALNLSSTDPGDDAVTGWSVDWGDGTVTTHPFATGIANHTYSSGGNFNILVSATDEDGRWIDRDLLVPAFESGGESVYRFDAASGAFLSTLDSSLGELLGPYHVLVGPNGDAYVSGFDSDNVVRYDASGNYLGEFVSSGLGGLDGASGMTFDTRGNLYVASYFGNEILRYDASGNFVAVFGTSGADMNGPAGLAFGPDGDLYVSSRSNNKVYKYDGLNGGSPSVVINSGLAGPEQLSFDENGNLFIADSFNNQIRKYDGSLTTFASGSGLLPGLAFAPEGLVYASDYAADEILVFDASTGASLGTLVSSGTAGLNQPYYVTLVPDQQVQVTHVNDAPILTPAAPVVGSTDEDTISATFSMAGIIAGTWTDADGDDAGVAVTALSGNGSWEYRIGGAGPWSPVDPVNASSALLLRDIDELRYVPDGIDGEIATISYRIWDQSAGSVGTKVNPGAGGGTTAYSTTADSASLTVTPVNDEESLTVNNVLFTSEGATATIDNSLLATTDIDDPPGAIAYSVTGGPTNGQLELTTVPGFGISTFTQDDIDNNRVVYVHAGTNTTLDSFNFDVDDGQGTATGSQTFNVAITAIDDDAPALVNNTGSTVAEGGTDLILPAELRYDDSEQPPASVTFSIVGGLTNGRLELTTAPGLAISSFTQDDVDNNRLAYVHDGGESTSDTVVFDVHDGRGNTIVGQTFLINVAPTNDAPVTVVPGTQTVTESTPTLIGGISVADSDAGAASITTRLNAANGVLDVTLAGSAVISMGANGSNDLTIRGTLADVNATLASLQYTLNPGVSGIAADTITVTINDQGNSGAGGPRADVKTIQLNTIPPLLTATSDPTSAPDGDPDQTIEEANVELAPAATTPPTPNSADDVPRSRPASNVTSDEKVSAPTSTEETESSIVIQAITPEASNSPERRTEQRRDENAGARTSRDIAFATEAGHFWDALDLMDKKFESDIRLPDLTFGGVTAVSSALSVGYVVWLLKGGHILAGILAQMPAWRLIDPLPVLAALDHDDQWDEECDDDSLQTLMEKNEQEREKAAAKTESQLPAAREHDPKRPK